MFGFGKRSRKVETQQRAELALEKMLAASELALELCRQNGTLRYDYEGNAHLPPNAVEAINAAMQIKILE